MGFPGDTVVKIPPANAGDVGSIPVSGRSLEEEMATHSCIFPGEIPWTEETVGLQFMQLQRVGDNIATQQGHMQMLRLKR